MPLHKVTFWRHGQTDLNLALRIQGGSDYPLNQTGLDQARVAAPVLADETRPTAIYSSNLERAYATAEELAAVTGLPVAVDERMRERSYGDWEGHTGEEILAKWPEAGKVWREGGQPEGVRVETKTDCGARMAAAVEDIAVALADSPEPHHVIVTAHGGSILNGIVTLLGLDPAVFAGIRGMDNCNWSTLLYQPHMPMDWRLLSYNRGVSNEVGQPKVEPKAQP